MVLKIFYIAALRILPALILSVVIAACDSNSAYEDASPVVVIKAPTEGAVLSSTTLISLDATSMEGIDYVTFMIDGEIIGVDSLPPYLYEWDVSYWPSDTLHTISVTATDRQGNVGRAQNIHVSIDPASSPAPSLIDPAHRAAVYKTVPQVFSWRTFPGADEYEFEISTNISPSVPGWSMIVADTLLLSTAIRLNILGTSTTGV